MRPFEYETPTKPIAKPPLPQNEVSDTPVNSDHSARDPHCRACEYEPGYDWRTDPYYDEDAIRNRMKSAKAEHLPVSANDTKENKR